MSDECDNCSGQCPACGFDIFGMRQELVRAEARVEGGLKRLREKDAELTSLRAELAAYKAHDISPDLRSMIEKERDDARAEVAALKAEVRDAHASCCPMPKGECRMLEEALAAKPEQEGK